MKNYFAILTSLLVCFVFNMNAQTYKLKYDSLSCLQVEGKIINADHGSSSECFIELISNNQTMESIVLKEGKNKFKFVLSKNTFYSIRVTKAGFVTKLISVNTDMIVESEGVHVFKFETSLMTEKIGAKLNQDMLDFPVTIIQFDYEMDCFVHNTAYTAYIKKELFKRNTTMKPENPQHASTTSDSDLALNRK